VSEKPILKLDWCSHAAAKYAVEHWHYSGSLPTPPLVKIGVWENGCFIGCVLFSRGASKNLACPYGLTTLQVCELTRVALTTHATACSRILRIALSLLKKYATGLRLVISFADVNELHHGGIYQAAGWIFAGQTPASYKYQDRKGRIWHSRQVSLSGAKLQYGALRRAPKKVDCTKHAQLGKYRYLFPLDAAMRTQILPLAQPYPKRAISILADAPAVQAGESGAAPTIALPMGVD